MNYEFILLSHHVGVIAKRLCAAAETETAHEGDDKTPIGGWEAENLIRLSPYSWVTSFKKLERSNNYFSSYRISK